MPGFVDEVESGDRLRALEALRKELARGIERTNDGKELAALGLRLQAVLKEIDDLGGASQTETDDLAERRRAKLPAAARS